jgi:hypothetical protein
MSRQVSFSAAGKKLGGIGGAKTKAEMEREERGLEAESLMGRHVEQCETGRYLRIRWGMFD